MSDKWIQYIDEDNNILREISPDKKEKIWYTYHKNNKLKSKKHIFYGTTWNYEYDKNENEIHYKSSEGHECWFEYDENNNMIHHKLSDGREYFYRHEIKEIKYKEIEITKEEFEERKSRKKKKVSKFEIMDI